MEPAVLRIFSCYMSFRNRNVLLGQPASSKRNFIRFNLTVWPSEFASIIFIEFARLADILAIIEMPDAIRNGEKKIYDRY